MSDRELLSAISEMLDKKLDEKLDEKLDARLKPIEDVLYNVILPRLNTIESCYLDTFERYVRATERMESACDDVQLLKKVTTTHSQQIQELQQAVGG